jgi:alpha-D-xyloside xylohydrolase
MQRVVHTFDDMRTRAIEDKRVIRCSVVRARNPVRGADSLVLSTEAVRSLHALTSSASMEMFSLQERARTGESMAGTARIDLVAENVVRFRYAPGDRVPDNATPMVVGVLPPARHAAVETTASGAELVTGSMKVAVQFDPFRMSVTDAAGTRICGIGGPEKDHFCRWDSLNTGACETIDGGHPVSVESFDLRPGEAIYGFGETFIGLNKAGQTINLMLSDSWGTTTPRCYKNVPFFMSSRGYGVFFNHHSLMSFWVGSMSATDIQVGVEDGFLDYYVFVGSLKEILGAYTDLTGKPALPPAWSFGYWQSKISYSSAQEALDVAGRMRKNRIPCDVIHLDTHWFEKDWYCDLTFSKTRFPDPAGFIRQLTDMGFKLSLWQLPYLPEGSELFEELRSVDGFIKNEAGDIYNVGICFVQGFSGIVGVIDFTNPRAVDVYIRWLRRLFDLGARVIKTDFGEAIPLDGRCHNGMTGRQMRNLYPLLYNRAVFEGTQAATGDGIVWSRSAWAGNQRFSVHWGGDNSPNFENIVPQLAGGLSLGLSGFAFWSNDIGGFLGNTTDRLLIRWMQTGVLLSHARIHGLGPRELDAFKPETMAICREFISLRYRLFPYLYGCARECSRTGLPLARALVVEFQDDPNVWNLYDEYLLGDALLVAPIYDESESRRLYLPEGAWYDWWTGRRVDGGRWLQVEAPLDRIPLYVREGRVIPLMESMDYIGQRPMRSIELRVAPFTGDGETAFTAPVDESWADIRYQAANGRHRILAALAGVSTTLSVLGEVPVDCSLVMTGESGPTRACDGRRLSLPTDAETEKKGKA